MQSLKIIFIFLCTLFILSFSEKYPRYKGFDLREFEQSMKYIDSGKYDIHHYDETPYIKNADEDSTGYFTIDPFFMSDHEVSNGEYLEFLFELQKTDTNLYNRMLPDTMVWAERDYQYNWAFVEYYLRHPFYSLYPVVGVTYEQSVFYCGWLTKKYAKEENRKYKNAKFQLPSVKQWTWAAKGKLEYAMFSWPGISMTDPKGKWRANFRYVEQYQITERKPPLENIGLGLMKYSVVGTGMPTGAALKHDDVTVTAKAYKPNGYGLYNMSGNVEEYVAEKGISKGGSWDDPAYYLMNTIHKTYDPKIQASSRRGFRVAMTLN